MPLDDPRFAGFARHRPARAAAADAPEHVHTVAANVERYGWHIQHVLPDPGRIGWTYTIGFADSLGHPDLIVFGMDGNEAIRLLNGFGDAIADGARLEPGQRHTGHFDEPLDVGIGSVEDHWRGAHVGLGYDHYGEWPDLLQLLLPDVENRLPDDPYNDAEQFQLVLSRAAPAPRRLVHPHTPIAVDDARRVVVPDVRGSNPTGWLEEVIAVPGVDEGRFVVVSVPFVDQLSYGDEIEAAAVGSDLRIERVTDRDPVATVRMPILRGGEETKQRIADLLAAVDDDSSTVWESPVPEWLFFAVAHDRFDWFRELATPLGQDGIVGVQVVRPPAP